MNYGYICEHRRFPRKTQAASLAKSGVADDSIFVEGRRGESLEHVVEAARDGGTIYVMWLALLAQPGNRKIKTRPRDRLRKAVAEILANKTVIIETETGRKITKCNDEHVMMLDAVDMLANDARHPKGIVRPGPRTIEEKLGPKVLKEAKAIWRNVKLTTPEAIEKVKALGVSKTKAYEFWGDRQSRK